MNVKPNSGIRKIAFIGMGGIGSAFAFQLARTGQHDLTAIARPGSTRLKQLQHDGGVTKTNGEHAAMHVADCLEEGVPYDLILVTLPAHRLSPVMAALQRSNCRWIQFMINTFDPQRLRSAIGVDRCFFGMPFIQARITGGGMLDVKIGAGGQKSKLDSETGEACSSPTDCPRYLSLR